MGRIYFTVDPNGTERLWTNIPSKWVYENIWWNGTAKSIELPNGFIEKYLGKKMTWDDDPHCIEDI